MQKAYKFSILLALFIFLLTPGFMVSAQGRTAPPPDGTPGSTGVPPTDSYNIKIENPLKSGNDTLQQFIETVLRDVVIPIGAVIAVLFIVYAGFLYVTARGSEEKIATAHRALLYAVIGTAILLGSWVLSKGIASTINQIAAP